MQAKVKALAKCNEGIVKTGTGTCPDSKATAAITKAETKMRSTIDKTCGGNDKICGGVTTNEDTAYVFTVADFGFSDPNDVPANNLLSVKITTLPGAGTLTDNAVAVVAGQSIALADITGGLLQFTPAANANGAGYASFTFQVQDDGGTANGGVDLDPTPNTITVNVTAVNDAPAGTDKTVTTLEEESLLPR